MINLVKVFKLQIIFFKILPVLYIILYEIYYSQNHLIADQINFIYINQNLELIDDIYLTPDGYTFCERGYQRVQIYDNSIIVNQSQSYNPDSPTQVCVHRRPQSRIIDQRNIQQSTCSFSQKRCQYKDMIFCVDRKEKCPISDFILSSSKQIDDYQLTGSFQKENINVFVKRQSMDFNPLVQAAILEFNNENIDNKRYYKMDLLNSSQFNYEHDWFNDSTSLSPNIIYQYDQLIKGDEIKDKFSNKWAFKESVIYFKNSKECLDKRSALFDNNIAFFYHFSMIIVTLVVTKFIYFILDYTIISQENQIPYIQFTISISIEILYVYTSHYLKLDYYLTLESLLEKGCVDQNSEIRKMTQIFNCKYEIIGILMSSISLVIILIISFLIYQSCQSIKTIYKTILNQIQNKFMKKQQHSIKQQNLEQQVQVVVQN